MWVVKKNETLILYLMGMRLDSDFPRSICGAIVVKFSTLMCAVSFFIHISALFFAYRPFFMPLETGCWHVKCLTRCLTE